MEKKHAITFKSGSFVARVRGALRRLVGDRRGAELVEVLVVVAIIALGGIVAMNKIKAGTEKAADNLGGTKGIEGIQPNSQGYK